MPIMKFRCGDCGKEFAKIYFSSQHAPKACTLCGAENLEELGPAFPVEEAVSQRPMCMTCDACEDSMCEYLTGS